MLHALWLPEITIRQGQPYADPRLSPRGLPNPAGRFRRGATCGKWRTLAGDTRSVTTFVPEAG